VLWQERYRVAAVGLLATSALWASYGITLDGPRMAIVALALVIAMIYAIFADWQQLGARWRLAPALAATAAVAASVFWTDMATDSEISTSLTLLIGLTLAYVGFVCRPGAALAVGFGLFFVALAAYLSHDTIRFAVPFIAVPVATLAGELISVLAERSVRSSDRSKQYICQLEDVLRTFHRPESLQDAANQVAKAAIEIFEVERATVVLRDVPDGLVSVTHGPSSHEVPDERTAELVVATIGGRDPQIVPTSDSTKLLVLPLQANGQATGAVVVHPLVTDDPELSLDMARLFGTQMAVAIEHLFVINELLHASTRDELTGIGNRKHAHTLLASLEEGDAVIVLDLDGFKEVNDTYGHAAGDVVLQELSAHLRHCLRDSDTSARLGGDEFLIVARRAFADPLGVADRVISGWANAGRSTTLSAGVALHEPNADPTTTMERADQALYQAKESGKNRARMWLPTAVPAQGADDSVGVVGPAEKPKPATLSPADQQDRANLDRRTRIHYPGFPKYFGRKDSDSGR